MRGITERQRICLAFIHESVVARGYAPTLREIVDRMAIRSTNGVNDHLRSLERKGFITRGEMLSRALVLTRAGYEILGVMSAREAPPTVVLVNPKTVGLDDIKEEIRKRGFFLIETSAIPTDSVEVRGAQAGAG